MMKPRNTSFMVEDILGLNRGKDRFKSSTKQRGEICNIIGERGADKTLLKSDVKSKEAAKRKRNRCTPTKSRQCFSTAEVSQLEQLFEETIGYPDTSTRRQLALEMQVSEAKIQIWFQNRRAKFRRQKRQQARHLNSLRSRYDVPTNNNILNNSLSRSFNFMNYLRLMSHQMKYPLIQKNREIRHSLPVSNCFMESQKPSPAWS